MGSASNLAKVKSWQNFSVRMKERQDDGTYLFEQETLTVVLDTRLMLIWKLVPNCAAQDNSQHFQTSMGRGET